MIGTTIGLGSNELARSLSDNILNPFLELILSNTIGLKFLQIKIKNVTFNIDKFLYQVLNFLLVLLVIYIVLRYIFYDLVTSDRIIQTNQPCLNYFRGNYLWL